MFNSKFKEDGLKCGFPGAKQKIYVKYLHEIIFHFNFDRPFNQRTVLKGDFIE